MAAEFGQQGASQNARPVADPGVPEIPELTAIREVILKLVEGEYGMFKQKKSFPDEGIEFVFLNVCRDGDPNGVEFEFIGEVIRRCLKLEADGGPRVLKYLFELQNSDGHTPLHAVIEHHSEDYLAKFMMRMPPESDPSYSILLNARDSRGWSPIHKIFLKYRTLQTLEKLVKDIDVSAELPGSNATVLHLAILKHHSEAVKIILEGKLIDAALNTIMTSSIVYWSNCKGGEERSSTRWSPLQLAAIIGDPGVVDILLRKIEKIYDSSKRHNHRVSKPETYDDAIPALHLAAASGVPEVVRLFTNGKFDPTKLTPQNRTPVHFAIVSSTPKFTKEVDGKHENEESSGTTFSDPFVKHTYGTELQQTASKPSEDHEVWSACITMLLQAGVDIWQKDDEDSLAGPGPEAPTQLRLWWYNERARDTSKAKKNLNDAANAVSVVAALVATASYVGPLTPPLGYGTTDPSVLDLVQTTKLLIRVFVVTNCLSFYLAIGSILFAVVPSLPMPLLDVESLYEEWQRSKRTIGVAILFLLLSIVGVLISFAAASNVGMEDHYSWQHLGLAFYPTIFGSFICLFGIIAFFIRLLRLVFDKNTRIRRFYQKLPPM